MYDTLLYLFCLALKTRNEEIAVGKVESESLQDTASRFAITETNPLIDSDEIARIDDCVEMTDACSVSKSQFVNTTSDALRSEGQPVDTTVDYIVVIQAVVLYHLAPLLRNSATAISADNIPLQILDDYKLPVITNSHTVIVPTVSSENELPTACNYAFVDECPSVISPNQVLSPSQCGNLLYLCSNVRSNTSLYRTLLEVSWKTFTACWRHSLQDSYVSSFPGGRPSIHISSSMQTFLKSYATFFTGSVDIVRSTYDFSTNSQPVIIKQDLLAILNLVGTDLTAVESQQLKLFETCLCCLFCITGLVETMQGYGSGDIMKIFQRLKSTILNSVTINANNTAFSTIDVDSDEEEATVRNDDENKMTVADENNVISDLDLLLSVAEAAPVSEHIDSTQVAYNVSVAEETCKVLSKSEFVNKLLTYWRYILTPFLGLSDTNGQSQQYFACLVLIGHWKRIEKEINNSTANNFIKCLKYVTKLELSQSKQILNLIELAITFLSISSVNETLNTIGKALLMRIIVCLCSS